MRKVTRLNKSKIITILKETSVGLFGVNPSMAELVATNLMSRQNEVIEEVWEHDDYEEP